MHAVPSVAQSGLPLVVQVAFSGSRSLVDQHAHPEIDAAAFDAAVCERLVVRLGRLAVDLGLPPHIRLVGVSSLAKGADTLFSRACRDRRLGWRHRVLLPQARDAFLATVGSDGPDFTLAEAALVRQLLDDDVVVEERIVGSALDRRSRFEEVNLELAKIADVVVCLVRADAGGKQGGARSVIELAARRHRPALVLTVSVGSEGRPALDEVWHWNPPPDAAAARLHGFPAPGVPRPLHELSAPPTGLEDPERYCNDLKTFCSRKAAERQRGFVAAAWVIVGTHVVATALALVAVTNHVQSAVLVILLVELGFLFTGWRYHRWLHHAHAVREWAMARLVAEVARSVIPLAVVPGSMRHLFHLPMPAALGPLLQTLNVLHLQRTRGLPAGRWQERRDRYVAQRLRDSQRGQIGYYSSRERSAGRWLRVAQWVFALGSVGAMGATLGKFVVVAEWLHMQPELHDATCGALGFVAVLLPVVAVTGLSLAAAFDLEARAHTYADMHAFLVAQAMLIEGAASENEFAVLAQEAEARLLGETANWYARRTFLGVA